MNSPRKIILEVAVSLDGLIEGPHGEYDWCFNDQEYGLEDFVKRIDTIFFGRKSYDVMQKEIEKSGQNPFPGIESYVFSTTLTKVAGAHVIGSDFIHVVSKIKKEAGKDIWLFGGAVLVASLLNAGLVDEISMAVHPIILGTGKPLFQGVNGRIKTQLIDSKSYSTGLISLHYQIVRN